MSKKIQVLFLVLSGCLYSFSGFSQIEDLPKFQSAQEAFDSEQVESAYRLLQELMTEQKAEKAYDNYLEIGIELAKKMRYFDDYGRCDSTLKALISESKKLKPIEQAHVGMLWHQLGVLNYFIDDYPASIEAYKQAIQVRTERFGEFNTDLANTYHNLGVAHRLSGQFSASQQALEQAVHIRKELGIEKKLADSYNQLGIVHESMSDMKRALDNYQLARSLYEKTLAEDEYWNLANCIRDIGIVHRKSNQAEKALPAFKEAQQLYINLYGSTDIDVADSYVNLANTYDDLGFYELAEESGLEAIRQYKSLDMNPSRELLHAYNNLGVVASHLGESKRAMDYINQALEQADALEAEGARVTAKASIYDNLADLKTSSSIDEAIQYYHQALQEATYGFENEDILSFPDADARFLRERREVLTIWYSKIRWMIEGNEGRVEWLEAALEGCMIADQIISEMHQHFSEEASSFFLSETARGFYDSGIQVALTLASRDTKHIEQAFELAERGKSVVLLASQKDNQAMAAAGIPKEMVLLGQDIQQNIAYQENRLIDLLTYESENESSIRESRTQLADLKDQWETHSKTLENQYPEYYQLKYASNRVNLKRIQSQLLDPETMLVEYFWGADQVYVFMITQSAIQTTQFPIDDRLQRSISNLLDFLYRPEQMVYPEDGFALSSRLLGLVPRESIKRLLIIPDGPLFALPFEVLVTQSPSASLADPLFPYWLQKWSISYAYSAQSVLLTNEGKGKRKKAGKVLGVAPLFDQSEYAQLAFSEQELEQLDEHFRLKSLMGEKALKESFIKQAHQYSILHLSTHAAVGDSSEQGTWIAFFPEGKEKEHRLSLNELYSLELNAELVVLSACETGRGKLESGEGAMSLARGFAYAGSKSILTTLWPVNHQSTVRLSGGFYDGLAIGNTKDKALQISKLAYLADESIDAFGKHPYYWAPYVLIGSTSSLEPWQIPNWIKYWAMVPVLMLFAYIIFKIAFLYNRFWDDFSADDSPDDA